MPAILMYNRVLAHVEVVYRMPDHRNLLQLFLWQTMDTRPHFPTVSKFLKFWREHLEGPIHDVQVKWTPIDDMARVTVRHADAAYLM
jgi:uncharacterized protein Usg